MGYRVPLVGPRSKVADWWEETLEQTKSLSLAGGAAWRLERRSGVGSGGSGLSAGGIGSESLGRRV